MSTLAAVPALTLGEIRTCLLMNNAILPRATTLDLLRLLPGERVRVADRPIMRAVSPETVTGVDCGLPARSGANVRGVGTIAAHAAVTAGRVLQGSASVALVPSPSNTRVGWSHYMARPGVVETVGRVRFEDVAEGFLAGGASQGVIDLGAVGDRMISRVQAHHDLDRDPPFRSARTWLRWSLELAPGPPRAAFRVGDGGIRTLRMTAAPEHAADAAGFCEDIAYHDWLLTTLLALIDKVEAATVTGRDPLEALRPAVLHLLHLWMPGAHTAPSMRPLWAGFERYPGFSRQWDAIVARIRDRMALHTIEARGKG